MAAVAVLATACGVVHVHFGSSGGSASAGSPTYQAELAYAQCMRAHGLSGFPNPNPSGGPSIHHQLNGNPNSPAARANDACKHLLTGGRTGTGGATATASPPGAAIREVLIPSSYPVADVALSIRQDTRRRDSGTGQPEAGS